MMNRKLINWINSSKLKGYTTKQLRVYLAKKGYPEKDIDEAFNSIKNKKSDSVSESFDFWDKLKYLFSNPNLFFKKIKSEEGLKNALLMYAIVGIFMAGIGFLFSYMLIGFASGRGFYSGFYYGLIPFFAFFGYIIGLVITFLYSGLIHALVIAFKGSGKYSDTYKAYTYGMVPFLLLTVVPMIGFLSIIYSIILMIIGISKLHNISKGKSAIACLLPGIFLLGLLVILIIFYLSLFFGF